MSTKRKTELDTEQTIHVQKKEKLDSTPSTADTPISSSTPMSHPVCPHLSCVRQPVANKLVYKEECTQCFQADTALGGIDVCLNCFNGGCAGSEGESFQHSLRHARLCKPIVLNIRRVPIVNGDKADIVMTPAEDAAAIATATGTSALQQLEAHQKRLEEEANQPEYKIESTVRCLECRIDIDPSSTPSLAACVDSVLKAQTMAQSAGVAMVEEDIKQDCTHAANLKQIDQPPQLGERSLTCCSQCDVKEDMWLCLTCGALGCSRKQMKSDKTFTSGNGHGVAHSKESGHPLVVKIGTITAEGRGDCYCYHCDSSVVDKNLISHLNTFGIVIDSSTTATTATMAELNLEMNLKMNWSLVVDGDGKEAELAFGPGKTGLANLGNSCYMASVLQVLFSLPHFEEKYYQHALSHLSSCDSSKPAECFQCQMSKLSYGMLSGRYDPTPSEAEFTQIAKERQEREERNKAAKEGRANEAIINNEEIKRKPLQSGIPPRMFKSLISGRHPEFSTGRQQDSYEYFHFLLDQLKQKEHASKFDPYQPFGFYQEERLECTRCNRVRYSTIKSTELALPIPLPEPLPPKESPVEPSSSSSSSATAKKKPAKEYPPVSFDACLNEWSQPQVSADWTCPHCNEVSSAKKSSRMLTYPPVLIAQMRRFVFEGWVPEKLDIEVKFDESSNGRITLDQLRAHGLQVDEVELPKGAPTAAAAGGSAQKVPDAAIVANLESMGFGTNACQRAALAVDNASADAAAGWLFSHMDDSDLNDPLPSSAPAAVGASASSSDPSPADINYLAEMGFDSVRSKYALKQCGNNAERAIEWLFSHGDEDIPMEDAQGQQQQTAHKEEIVPDTAPATYELFAFITHMGKSTGSGHYVAHVYKSGRWMQFNDHKVSYVDQPIKHAAHAYMYFFRRV